MPATPPALVFLRSEETREVHVRARPRGRSRRARARTCTRAQTRARDHPHTPTNITLQGHQPTTPASLDACAVVMSKRRGAQASDCVPASTRCAQARPLQPTGVTVATEESAIHRASLARSPRQSRNAATRASHRGINARPRRTLASAPQATHAAAERRRASRRAHRSVEPGLRRRLRGDAHSAHPSRRCSPCGLARD